MSIETEFESTITNVKNAYQGLDNLGATIPENKTIENIKSCLDEIYNKFPKTSYAEGTEITLSNTLKGKLDFDNGVVGIGQSSQDSTQGYQLVDVSTSEIKSQSNITASKDGNVISMNGTANALGILADVSNFILPESGNTYTFKVIVEGGEWTAGQIGFRLLSSGGTQLYASQANYSQKYVVQQASYSGTPAKLQIYFTSTSVFNNAKIRLLLTLGNDTTKSFEPYTGGQPSPNPSYPQDIKVVRGKNRLKPITVNRTIKGVTITSNNGKITIKGTATDSINEPIWGSWGGSNVLCELPQGSYVSSGLGTNSPRLNIVANGTTTIFTGNSTRTLTSTAKITGIFIYINNGESVDMTFEPMIEKGSQATSYLPYNTLEVVERGKNYCGFNSVSSTGMGVDYIIDKSEITLNGTTNGGGYIYTSTTNFITIPKGTYKLSGYILGGSYNYVGDIEIALKKASDNTKVLALHKTHYDNQATITLTEDTDLYYGIYTNGSNNVLNNFKIGIQIEEGSTTTTYEPYITPTSYQLSLGDIQLNAIGNYKDELIYDVEKDKVYKNSEIGKVVLNGTETYWQVTEYSGYYQFFSSSAVTKAVDNNTISVLSDKFLGAKFSDRASKKNIIYSGNNDGKLRVLPDDNTINTVELWTTWLSTHNTEVYYVLATPTLTEITDTNLHNQVKELYNAHSNNGTTIITSNGDLPMIIKCRGLKGE